MKLGFTRRTVLRFLFSAASVVAGSKQVPQTLSNVPGRGGWWPLIREPFGGAWQRNMTDTPQNVLAFSAVYACVTLIASDIAKLRIKLVELNESTGIWSEVENPAFSPVLRKPNRYQNRIAFVETWQLSKLIHGNAYILKSRDRRGVVDAMYVLDPTRVRPMVAPDGSVFYAISGDSLSSIPEQIVAPASEVIHDMMPALYHPLVGVSPLTACGRSALLALQAQQSSQDLFENRSVPSGALEFPERVDEETARKLQDDWQVNFTGENFGRVAVLGGGLKYVPIPFVSAKDSELIAQLKWSGEDVCRAFHVPAYKVGLGPAPAQHTVEMLNQEYYAQCLQNPIERMELLLDEGLGLAPDKIDGRRIGVEFDLDDLLRMDAATQVKVTSEGVLRAIFKPNEARARFNLPPVEGGDACYLQQQQFSLEALAKRDAKADPFAKEPATAPQVPARSESTEADDVRALVMRGVMEMQRRQAAAYV